MCRVYRVTATWTERDRGVFSRLESEGVESQLVIKLALFS